MKTAWVLTALLVIGMASPLFARSAQDAAESRELTIYINGQHAAIISALTCAAEVETTITGVAAFDSLSAAYGLRSLTLGDILGVGSCIYFPKPNSFCAFRLTFSSLVYPATVAAAYRSLSYIGFAEFDPPLWPLVDYHPGSLLISIKEGYESVVKALLCAFETETTLCAFETETTLTTGVADFDSLSVAYGLWRACSGLVLFKDRDDFPASLCSVSSDSPYFSHRRRRLFDLYFPFESNMVRIAKAYEELPYIEATSVGVYGHTGGAKSVLSAWNQNQPCATSALSQSWGRIKSKVKTGDRP